VLFEEVPEARLVLREGHERTELGWDRRHPQQLTEQAAAKGDNVGADGYGLAPHRLDVAGMFGSLVGEALLVDLVHLLHALDDLDQVLGRRAVGVEGHDDASDDAVHLRPMHPFDGVQCPLQVAGQSFALRVVDPAYFNVSFAVTDPRPASSPARTQAVQRAADDRAGERRALAQQPEWVHRPVCVGLAALCRWSDGRRGHDGLGASAGADPLQQPPKRKLYRDGQDLHEQPLQNDFHPIPPVPTLRDW
jgi:hypothetical protein